jgi:hypothetical protein
MITIKMSPNYNPAAVSAAARRAAKLGVPRPVIYIEA